MGTGRVGIPQVSLKRGAGGVPVIPPNSSQVVLGRWESTAWVKRNIKKVGGENVAIGGEIPTS